MLNAQQIEARNKGIGGSDAGAVCGLSPFKTAYQVWAEKTGVADNDYLQEVNTRQYWGNVIESAIAQGYSDMFGVKLHQRNMTQSSARFPWMKANIDRWVVGAKKGLECKNVDKWNANAFGESGTDEVPPSYLIQCTHYMIVLGVTEWDLAALIGGNDLRVYHLTLDDELAEMVIEREHDFWHEYVLKSTPPPFESYDDLQSFYAKDNGQAVTASEEIVAAIEDIKHAKDHIKSLENFVDKKKLEICSYMQNASAVRLTDSSEKPLATWKASTSKRIDVQSLRAQQPDIANRFTVESSSRRFLIK